MNYRSFLILFLVSINLLQAQISDFNFRNFNISDGLSNNTVASITQDKLGQIWIATSNGLNKFNGKEFVIYRNIPDETSSISSSDILNVLEDREGNIWAGTFNGLNKYEPQSNLFKKYFKSSNKNSLSSDAVISSLEMKSGSIWFGTSNGVSIYDKKTDSFTRFLQGKGKNRPIYDIYVDKRNVVWLATKNNIIRVNRDREGKFTTRAYSIENSKNRFHVNKILEIEKGVLGIASKYDGYLLFDTQTEQFSYPEHLDILQSLDIQDLEKDEDGNLWVATTNGLFIVTSSKKIIRIAENEDENYGSIKNRIKTIYKDKSNSIWLGTESFGVSTWHKSNQNFKKIKNPNSYNNITNTIITDKEQNIYFGTEGGSVNVLEKNNEVTEIIKIQDSTKTISYPVRSLYCDENNLLWIGTLNRGLKIYDLETKKELKNILSNRLKNYTENTSVLDIKKGTGHDVWIGTYGRGLLQYNTKTKRLKVYKKPSLASSIIRKIHVDENSVIAGGLGGVSILERNGSKFQISNYFNEASVKRFNITTIYKDSNDIIWIGTKTRGLYKFNGKDFKPVVISANNKIFTINSILEDDKDGVLWIGTDKGIVRYNVFKKESIIYNQQNIEPNNDFIMNAALKVDNQYYFGALQGIIMFNPDKIVKYNFKPKVILSELKIRNEKITAKSSNQILLKSISYTKKIELTHDKASFSISYAFPNYINSKNNQYAYRLKGLEDDWFYTKQTEAFFALQTSGAYTFQVKAADYDGVWSDEITELKIKVHPAPWRTWWAYVIYCIVSFGLVFGIVWILQSKSRLQHKLKLEYIENKKKEELNQAKLKFFTNISHEFRTPLTLILGPLQSILNDYSGSKTIYKKLKVMDSSANHLLRLINRLMDFRKLESNQLQLEAAEGNIVKFLQEIFLSFSEYAKNGKYNYKFNTSDDEILVFYDRYKLERVFYNLISNAFKHTKNGGDITVNIYKEDNDVVIEVKDSGNGVPEEFLDKIFDRFFEVSNNSETNTAYNKGTGIGLSIASNIVKLHHGEISVKNIKPEGAVFIVKLKLGKGHLSENEILKNFKMSDDVSQYVTQISISDTEINNTNSPKDLLLEKKKYTILIAEDNTVLRSFIKEILKPKYNIIQAENGKVALQKAIEYLPDLIISDVMMPEMVGTELCSKIKTTIATSHIPVILLTSRSALVYKFEGLESGADDYISKPFNLKEFKLKIQNLLEFKERLKDKFSSNENFGALDVSLTSLDQQLLDKALEIVHRNMSNQDFNISHFSEELGVSRSILFTKIKAWANVTPNDFIQDIRLNHAMKLLELNRLNITEVAYAVGFKRPKYFSQRFQQKFGLTPSEFSKKFTNTSS
ncbi:hybrid sensor histidine kinase/response regulator transcription factor [Hyunsoonleella ulvae]|uniref:hybrid sensor histidine kinase/response regulator transcription factor n=1 Tax=Hyunsoonleella ulvae TaxID=2799948 RepID=UPI00193A4BD2|nr:hybrid sensor histidine kinase/response regulator transcription factor [Hyunsoonleella ulvae]